MTMRKFAQGERKKTVRAVSVAAIVVGILSVGVVATSSLKIGNSDAKAVFAGGGLLSILFGAAAISSTFPDYQERQAEKALKLKADQDWLERCRRAPYPPTK